MSGKYLLDTNVAIRVLNREIDLEARRQGDFEAVLSVTVVGELPLRRGEILEGRSQPRPSHAVRVITVIDGLAFTVADGQSVQTRAWPCSGNMAVTAALWKPR